MSKILNIGIKVQEKTVTPSTERQVITADSGYTCLDKVIVEPQSGIPEPTKSWLYITEYDSNGNPIKAKTIGCSGDMPYNYMYGAYSTIYVTISSRFLQEFEINEGVTSTSGYSFSYCSNLRSITIPGSVTSIGGGTFKNCKSLTRITIPNSVTSIGGGAFNECSSLTSITIPDGVTMIEGYTFTNCKSLTRITIGNSVTSIGDEAFSSCLNLKLFDFRREKQVPTLSNTSAFYNTPSTKKIVVPDSLYDEWIVATNWSSLASYIVKASEYEASL